VLWRKGLASWYAFAWNAHAASSLGASCGEQATQSRVCLLLFQCFCPAPSLSRACGEVVRSDCMHCVCILRCHFSLSQPPGKALHCTVRNGQCDIFIHLFILFIFIYLKYALSCIIITTWRKKNFFLIVHRASQFTRSVSTGEVPIITFIHSKSFSITARNEQALSICPIPF